MLSDRMKIILAGGTGFIGRSLANALASDGYDLVILSRSAHPVIHGQSGRGRVVQWDGESEGSWMREVDGAYAVINFAGEPIAAKRWTKNQKQKILRSRIDATAVLVSAMGQAKERPAVFVSGSAVGYYGHVVSDDVHESYPRGVGFIPDLVQQWEDAARTAEPLGIRVVLLRTGVVLGTGGGALAKMVLPFKLFVGGSLGSGNQWFPWVHISDLAGAVLFVLGNRNATGELNLVAPSPVRMKEFCATLAASLHRPSWARVPSFVLRIVLGEMADMFLTGQKVIPRKLVDGGYQFRYPDLAGALGSIYGRPD